MDSAKPHLKIAALASAVLGVGAFVAYRAGAFTPLTPPEAPPPDAFMSGSKSAGVFTPVEPPPPQSTPVDPTFMGGSKSIIISGPPAGIVPVESPKPAPSAPVP